MWRRKPRRHRRAMFCLLLGVESTSRLEDIKASVFWPPVMGLLVEGLWMSAPICMVVALWILGVRTLCVATRG